MLLSACRYNRLVCSCSNNRAGAFWPFTVRKPLSIAAAIRKVAPSVPLFNNPFMIGIVRCKKTGTTLAEATVKISSVDINDVLF